MIVFDGREFSKKQKEKLKLSASKWQKEHTRLPKVAFFLVGENSASELYIKQKQKVASEIGVEVLVEKLSGNEPKEEIIKKINEYSKNPLVDGITVQLPLPGHLKESTQEILDSIASEKDIDGLASNSTFLSAVVRAVLEVMKAYEINPKEQVCAVVGAKGWVGKKMTQALKDRGAKVLEIDLGTEEKLSSLKGADVIISCTGNSGIIMGDYIKEGAKVFDLGVMVVEKGVVKGDLDFDSVKEKASFITPVPGGIGPVTVVSLFANLLEKCW